MICRIRFICRIVPNNFVVIIKRVIVITIISSYIRRLYQIWLNWDNSFQKQITTLYIITTYKLSIGTHFTNSCIWLGMAPSNELKNSLRSYEWFLCIQIVHYTFQCEQILREIIQYLILCSSEYLKEWLCVKKCQTCWHFWRMNFYCTMVCRLAAFRIQN